MNYKNIEITKYLQSGFRIDWTGEAPKSNKSGEDEIWVEMKKVIYIDPFKLPPNQPRADLILISHEHFDHCELESIERIYTEGTTIVCNELTRNYLTAITNDNIVLLSPNRQINLAGLVILGLPAYNTNKTKTDGTFYHPKENFGLGFLLSFNIHDEENEVRLYHMGDTDYVEGEQNPVDLDILMVPVSGIYVMTVSEALEATKSIKPEIAIPMHYDAGIAGSHEDAKYFMKNSRYRVEVMEAIK